MRIDDISPTTATASLAFGPSDQSICGKGLSVALSADGMRAYVGGHSGVWRSDDGGQTWFHPEWPQPAPGSFDVPGALRVPNVYDLLISPLNNDVVLAATGHDARTPEQSGIYRSVDGALTWSLVHQFNGFIDGSPFILNVSQLTVAPDDPNLIFAAGGFAIAVSEDGGMNWTERRPLLANREFLWHVAVGPLEGAKRRIYAVGSTPSVRGVYFSDDAGQTWIHDPVLLQQGAASGSGLSAKALAIHPLRSDVVYLTMTNGTVWRGLFLPVQPNAGFWTQLASPPIIPGGPTASGGNFLMAHAAADGHVYLICSDRRFVHVARSDPFDSSQWTRLEDSHCHADPHAMAFTPDFSPHTALGPPDSFGRALLINDGGINISTDGAKTWSNATGLSTLSIVNVAVVSSPGEGPVICIGTGDNRGFSTQDNGVHWNTQDYDGGDNDCAFADVRQPSRMIVFAPRSKGPNEIFGEIYRYVGQNGHVPDIAWGTSDRTRTPGPENLPVDPGKKKIAGWNVVSSYVNHGYRPLVLTLPNEAPLPDGDTVVIRFTPDDARVLRTTKLGDITDTADWNTTAAADGPGVKVFQIGSVLPVKSMGVVQTSGGHAHTAYYVSDPFVYDNQSKPGTKRLWRFHDIEIGTASLIPGLSTWQLIVPSSVAGARPATCRRFFVDPYRPNVVYVLDTNHIFRTDDGGATWVIDSLLERALTADGQFGFNIPFDENPAELLLRDMQFDPELPGTRFAAGPAGVFHTRDGAHWDHILFAESIGARTNQLFYDHRSCGKPLYVGTSNRGLLRISPIPPEWDYPMSSLQAARGRVTLLRVHDLETGYGPPDDQLDAEVIVWLDTEPQKAFGFQLRDDGARQPAEGKLTILRDAFNQNVAVQLDFTRTGCRTGTIVRVMRL
jgi:photosystem II stability/assembly factor-like uncharacterized protein